MPRISLAQRMNGASRMSVAAADQYTPMVLDYDSLIPSEEMKACCLLTRRCTGCIRSCR